MTTRIKKFLHYVVLVPPGLAVCLVLWLLPIIGILVTWGMMLSLTILLELLEYSIIRLRQTCHTLYIALVKKN